MFKSAKSIWPTFFRVIFLALLLTGCADKPVQTPPPQATRDANDERKLEQQLEEMNPKAVAVFQDGTKAMDSGDYEKAIQAYQQVIVLAPNFSAAYRRLGYMELNRNNIEQAEELSRKALELELNSFNKSSLALVLLQKNIPKDTQEAYNLATEAVELLPDDSQANFALLLSALALEKLDIAHQADQRLLELEPYNPFVHYFAGLLAATDGKWEQAEKELLYAQELGVDPSMIQEALDKGI